MPQATIGDHTTVDYLVAGTPRDGATDLILIHGTAGSAETNFGHLLGPLTADGARRVIAPNLSGSGASTDPGGPLEVAGLAGQVAAAAAHAGSERYDVAGFSLGGTVAAQLAATHPERVRRLILIAGIASSHDGRMPLQMGLWQHLLRADREALARHLTLTGFSAPFLAKRPTKVIEQMVAETEATLAPGTGRQAELDTRIDITALLPTISAPTLVITGTDDHMVPAAQGRALLEGIPGARHTELPSGHLIPFEQAAALVAAIGDFLA